MSCIVRTGVAAVALALVASTSAPARAEEVKSAVSATLLFNVLAPPSELRARAFDESLRDPGPPPPRSAAEVAMSHVIVTVKNPCPPGTAHYEPPPLPGRRK